MVLDGEALVKVPKDEKGKRPQDATLAEMDVLWNVAKAKERE